jgi:hypothetical protein
MHILVLPDPSMHIRILVCTLGTVSSPGMHIRSDQSYGSFHTKSKVVS